MNTKSYSPIFRPVLLLLIVLVISSAAFSQIKLRNVLDYDGDGKADLAIYREQTSTWYNLKSNGNVFNGFVYGVSDTDIPAPGDYDGDGKGDIGVWRYSNGVFYYLLSSTSTYGARAWGGIGDEIIQRDYDGDGKTDMAI